MRDEIMDNEKIMFYSELRRIQDLAIGTSLSKQSDYKKIEDVLEDVTYDIIYMMCEMIDGYRNNSIKYRLVNEKSDSIVNDGFTLHDWCEAYLRCSDV